MEFGSASAFGKPSPEAVACPPSATVIPVGAADGIAAATLCDELSGAFAATLNSARAVCPAVKPVLSLAASESFAFCNEEFCATLLLPVLLCVPAVAPATLAVAVPKLWFSRNPEFTAGAIRCGKAEAADCAPDPAPEKKTENGVGPALDPFSEAESGELAASFKVFAAPALTVRALAPLAASLTAGAVADLADLAAIFPGSAGPVAGPASAGAAAAAAAICAPIIPLSGPGLAVAAEGSSAAGCGAVFSEAIASDVEALMGGASGIVSASPPAGLTLANKIGAELTVSIERP